METIKKITIKDLDGQKLTFSVRLFDALDGIDFVDRYVSSKDKSIKPFWQICFRWRRFWMRAGKMLLTQ